MAIGRSFPTVPLQTGHSMTPLPATIWSPPGTARPVYSLIKFVAGLILRGTPTPPRGDDLGAPPPVRTGGPAPGQGRLVVPRPRRQAHRRFHRDHARYPGEPGGLSPARQPGARGRVPDRATPRRVQPGRRHGPRGGAGAVPGQADRRTGPAPPGPRPVPVRRHRL